MHDEKIRSRLWEHILEHAYGTSDLAAIRRDIASVGGKTKDIEGHAFFLAIDAAFTQTSDMRGCVPVDRELVQYLAGWCRESAFGEPQRGGPTENHFVSRALDGFISTLYEAIWRKRISRLEDGVSMFGCYKIPVWFIKHSLELLKLRGGPD